MSTTDVIVTYGSDGKLVLPPESMDLRGADLAKVTWELVLLTEEAHMAGGTHPEFMWWQKDWRVLIGKYYMPHMLGVEGIPQTWCGTAFCFAGFASLIATHSTDFPDVKRMSELLGPPKEVQASDEYEDLDGLEEDDPDDDEDDDHRLFYAGHTLQSLHGTLGLLYPETFFRLPSRELVDHIARRDREYDRRRNDYLMATYHPERDLL